MQLSCRDVGRQLRYAGFACAVVFALTLPGCSGRGELPDFASIEDVKEMKRSFYEFLQPVAAAQNAHILEQRMELAETRAVVHAGERPGWFQRRTLKALAEEYEVVWTPDALTELTAELWARVDVVPLELTLAQAAKESGWGRSRFAVEANNLFGQWCYETGCGLVPAQRPANATHEVAAFDSVRESIRRYMNNLNTHERYANFRALRAQLRSADQPLSGVALAPGLLGYSERGQPYVDEVLAMMRQNASLLRDGKTT